MSIMKCPHCGREYSERACKLMLIPLHSYPLAGPACPGSGQYPRCAASDRRPLWKDLGPDGETAVKS